MPWTALAAGAAGAAAIGAAGCGSDDTAYSNEARPPAAITITAAIDTDRVRVSPPTFGAGPITIIVSNQSGAPQQVTFETDEVGGTQGGIRRKVGPVADRDTASLQADPRRGTYRLAVGDESIKAAAIDVGAPRRSAQDKLLQP